MLLIEAPELVSIKQKGKKEKIYRGWTDNFSTHCMYRKRLNNKMTFQQDAAPGHFSKEVHTWFNENFNGVGELVDVVEFLGHHALQF